MTRRDQATKPRTVLQITPYYPPHLGGLERVVQHLADGLGARGHEVRVVTTGLGAAGASRRSGTGAVTVRRHRAVELAHTAIAPGLPLSLLRAPRDAVLHLHCAHALLPEAVAVVARLRRQPFLLHFHLDVDASGRAGALLPLYKEHVFGRVMRAAAGVVVLTEAQGAFVRERYRVPPERVHVVPNGVGGEYFMPVRAAAAATAAEPLRLLFVGRLSRQKNVGRLLDALAAVREPVRLRVVGDGELRAELEARATRLGLTGLTGPTGAAGAAAATGAPAATGAATVEFSGGLLGADLVRAYADADAFVLPSDKEGMPLVALEAMAAALPVLATRVPGSTELLGGVGLLADPEPAALAAGIDRLARDPDLRLRLARRSAEAAPGYSWEAVTRQVEQVYASALPPTSVHPPKARPTGAEPATPEPTRTEPTTAEATGAEPATARPSTVEPTKPQPTTAEPGTSEPTTTEPTTTEPTTPEPSAAAPAAAAPPDAEPTTPRPTGARP